MVTETLLPPTAGVTLPLGSKTADNAHVMVLGLIYVVYQSFGGLGSGHLNLDAVKSNGFSNNVLIRSIFQLAGFICFKFVKIKVGKK